MTGHCIGITAEGMWIEGSAGLCLVIRVCMHTCTAGATRKRRRACAPRVTLRAVSCVYSWLVCTGMSTTPATTEHAAVRPRPGRARLHAAVTGSAASPGSAGAHRRRSWPARPPCPARTPPRRLRSRRSSAWSSQSRARRGRGCAPPGAPAEGTQFVDRVLWAHVQAFLMHSFAPSDRACAVSAIHPCCSACPLVRTGRLSRSSRRRCTSLTASGQN